MMKKAETKGGFLVAAVVLYIVMITVISSWPRMAIAQNMPSVGRAYCWTGEVSTDWFEPANWSWLAVPVATDSVIIPAGCVRYPVLPAEAMAECGYFELQPAATFTFTNGTLSIGGDAHIEGHLIAGRGVLRFNGNKLQQISIAESISLHHIVVTNTSADGVVFQNRLRQTGFLYVAEGSICHLTTDDSQLPSIHSIVRMSED